MRTLLVDGNNLLSRADFAAKGKQVQMSAHGVNTASLSIFISMMAKHVSLIEPTHVAVMWDAGHAERDHAYPEYKANRNHREAGLAEDRLPFLQAQEFLDVARVLHLCCEGWEADDLIAVAARQVNGEVVILSGDKDLLQLVDHRTVQYRVPDDEPWDEEKVYAKFGCAPEHLPYYLALVGDPIDNVPGLKGVGPVKALKALETASWSWERLLASLEPEQAHTARTMRFLVDLRHRGYPGYLQIFDEIPPFEPAGLTPAVEAFLSRYELRTVHERLATDILWHSPGSRNQVPEGAFDDFVDLTGTHQMK